MAIKIGITGGIGSGKSMVSRLLEVLKSSCPYPLDLKRKRLMASDSLIREELSALLGAEVYAGGTLNKPLLASYLFGSPEHAKEIKSYCVSAKEDFRRWTQCRTAFPIVGIESAILVEAGFAGEVDAIVMVYAPEEVRISCAVRRDASSRELIEKRIRSQMDDEEKRKYADFVIVNDGETPLILQVLERERFAIKKCTICYANSISLTIKISKLILYCLRLTLSFCLEKNNY